MKFPAMEGGKCPECKTLAVQGSFAMAAASKSKACAGRLLAYMGTQDSGNRWMEQVLLQTGIKTDPSRSNSIYALYFKQLQSINAGSKFFVGLPLQYLSGKCAEAFGTVLNRGLPGGTVGAAAAADQMEAACRGS